MASIVNIHCSSIHPSLFAQIFFCCCSVKKAQLQLLACIALFPRIKAFLSKKRKLPQADFIRGRGGNGMAIHWRQRFRMCACVCFRKWITALVWKTQQQRSILVHSTSITTITFTLIALCRLMLVLVSTPLRILNFCCLGFPVSSILVRSTSIRLPRLQLR